MALNVLRQNSNQITGSSSVKPLAPVIDIRTKLALNPSQDPIGKRLRDREMNGSVDIDNTGRGVLEILNPAFLLNYKYGDVTERETIERQANGGMTNQELGRFYFNEAHSHDYHSSFNSPIIVPPQYKVGEKVTGNDGKSYTQVLDKVTGQVAYFDDGFSCVNPNSAKLNPDFRTSESLRDEGQIFSIQNNVNADGSITPKTATEAAVAAMFVDMDNRAIKLPYQLDMIKIISNDITGVPVSNDPVFGESNKPTNPSVMFKANKSPAPWEPPAPSPQ